MIVNWKKNLDKTQETRIIVNPIYFGTAKFYDLNGKLVAHILSKAKLPEGRCLSPTFKRKYS